MTNLDIEQIDLDSTFILDPNVVTEASQEQIAIMSTRSEVANQITPFYQQKTYLMDLPKHEYLTTFMLNGDDPEDVNRHSKFIQRNALKLNENLPENWQLHEVELLNACLYNNQIYFPAHEWALLHELNRPHESTVRARPTGNLPNSIPQLRFQADEIPTLLVTCEGSHNWGHFLLEDLTRIVHFIQRQVSTQIRIIMSDFSAESQLLASRKEQLVRGLFPHRQILFIHAKRQVPLYIDRVTYLTPVARHPIFHSRQLISSVLNQFERHHANKHLPSKRLLVLRKQSRRIAPESESLLIDMLIPHGFEIVYPEELDALEQAILFSEASHIIGTIGAAMANVIFSAPGTKVIHLSPDHWIELFYWELACIRRENYHAYYGKSIVDENKVWFKRDFSLNIKLLRDFLQQVLF